MRKLIIKEDAVNAVSQLATPEDMVSIDTVVSALLRMPVVNMAKLAVQLEAKKAAEWVWIPHNKPSGTIMYVQCTHCLKTNKVYATEYCPNCGYRMKNKESVLDDRH